MGFRVLRPAILCAAAAASWGICPSVTAKEGEYVDPAGVFSLDLPKRWRHVGSEAPPGSMGVTLAVFHGWFGLIDDENVPHVVLRVFACPGNARAGLAIGALHDPFGAEIPESRRVGPDFAESARTGLGARPEEVGIRRFVEKAGLVLCGEVGTVRENYDSQGDRIREVLDSLRPTGRWGGLPVPDGYRTIAEAGYDVLTDATAKSKGLAPAIAAIRAAFDAARAGLPGEPYEGLRPRIVVHAKEEAFRARRPAGFGIW